jgi:hypothetical protein
VLVARAEASCGSAVGVDAVRVAVAASRLRRHFGTDAPCLDSAVCPLGCARFFAFGFGFGRAGAVDSAAGAGVGVD